MSGEEEKNSENGKDSAEMIQEMRYNEVVCYEKLADWENAKQKASEYLIEYPEDRRWKEKPSFWKRDKHRLAKESSHEREFFVKGKST